MANAPVTLPRRSCKTPRALSLPRTRSRISGYAAYRREAIGRFAPRGPRAMPSRDERCTTVTRTLGRGPSDDWRRAEPEAEQKLVGDDRSRATQNGPKAETCRIGSDQRQFADRRSVGDQAYDIIIVRVVIDPRKPDRIRGARVGEERERATAGKQDKHEPTSPPEVSSGTVIPLDQAREALSSYAFTHAPSRRAEQGRTNGNVVLTPGRVKQAHRVVVVHDGRIVEWADTRSFSGGRTASIGASRPSSCSTSPGIEAATILDMQGAF